MKYSEFLKIAYPEHKKGYDSHLTILSRMYRIPGLFFGYVFYSLGLSANAVSLFRLLLIIIAFYFLTLTGSEFLILRLSAVLMLLASKLLDYSDGAIARAKQKPSVLGARLDEYSELIIHAGMALSLVAFYTRIPALIPYAIFLQWTIHEFGHPFSSESYTPKNVSPLVQWLSRHLLDTGAETPENHTNNIFLLGLNIFSKCVKADVSHFVFLPLIIAIFNNAAHRELLSMICLVILLIYSIVALLRFIGGVQTLSRK